MMCIFTVHVGSKGIAMVEIRNAWIESTFRAKSELPGIERRTYEKDARRPVM